MSEDFDYRVPNRAAQAADRQIHMAGSVNKVIIVGNLGADPEIRRTQDGKPIANLRIATSDTWRDKNSGERKEKTEWHSVVVFNEGLCKVIEQYVKKGSKLYIEGALQTRKWQDKDGQDRYSTEIVLQGFNSTLTILSGREGGGTGGDDYGNDYGNGDDTPPTKQSSGRGKPSKAQERPADMDDDIPF